MSSADSGVETPVKTLESPSSPSQKPLSPPAATSAVPPVFSFHDICYDILLKGKAKKQALAAAAAANDAAEKGPVAGPKGGKPGYRRILENISGSVGQGEMVAILGASGAGKTTLLDIIAARISNSGDLSGTVLYKGKPRKPSSWKRTVALVPQSDLLYGALTTEETLEFAAKLRLPSKYFSNEDKRQRVADTIEILGLEKARDTRIGDDRARGVSGGEKKRVSIGQELVSQPSLLLLDEPTSGLDSHAAYNVIDNLRRVTQERNMGVISTIHQPSWSVLTIFNKILLLARGSIFYEGSPQDAIAYFEKLGHVVPPGTNPADYFLTLAENHEKTDEGERRIIALLDAWRENASSSLPEKVELVEEAGADSPDAIHEAWPLNWFDEVRILAHRNLLQLLRDPLLIGATLGQTIILLVVLGFSFFRLGSSQDDVLSRNGAVFITIVNASFSVLFPVLSVFPLSRAIMKRERSAGTYRTSAFLLAKILIEVPSQIGQRLLFYIIFWWISLARGLPAARFGLWLATNMCQVISAVALGFAIGGVSPSVEVANIIAPGVNVLFLIFAGNLLPRPPPWFVWLRWISPLTYAYIATAQTAFKGLVFQCTEADQNCYQDGGALLQAYNLLSFTIAECIGFLFAISFVLFFLSYLGLRFTAGPKFRYR